MTHQPKPHGFDVRIITTVVTGAVFLSHILMYKPWSMPMPFKALLPTVHALLFGSGLAALFVAVSDAPQELTGVTLLYLLNLLIGPFHTFTYFVTESYATALKIMLLNTAVSAFTAGSFARAHNFKVAFPFVAATLWMGYVLYVNKIKADRAARRAPSKDEVRAQKLAKRRAKKKNN